MTQHSTHFSLSACALAGSLLLAACGGAESTDTVAPTVVITDSEAGATAAGPVTFTFAFSEDVGTSFAAEDITVTGGTAGTLTKVDDMHYRLVVTPAAGSTGTINVSVAAQRFTDLALNNNTAAASAQQAYDTTTAPPVSGGISLASFDEATPLEVNIFGGTVATVEAGPAGGGSGQALKLVRNGGEVWAGAWVAVPTIPSTTSTRTITAKVYSPTAGIPMVAKIEYGDNTGSGDTQASAPIVAGWQTVSWTFNNLDASKVYNRFVIIPNNGNSDSGGKTYYVDDITLAEAVAPPPTTGGSVLATFDEATPLEVNIFGGTVATVEAGPAGGGSGQALKLVRNGGEVWAGAWVAVPTIPSTTSTRTITAKVYSPTAGIPMVAKIEYGDNTGSGDTQASAPIVAGWQTVSWTFNNLDASKVYNRFVIIPNNGNSDSGGKTYYVDDITLADAAGGGTTTPGAEMGAGGPQTLTIATGDVKTGDGGNTMFVAGEGLFAVNYVGSAEAAPPNNLAAWPNAKTAIFASITGISGGDIGYFQDDVNLSNSSQKVEEGGWVSGTAVAPLGVPNFFRYFVLKAQVSPSAYMGLYMNAPNNGTVNVSGFSKIKVKVWGPGPMFNQTNFSPVLEVTLVGPKVAGCTTGSGGSEITQNLTANRKNGAGGFDTLLLSGFTVKGLCGTDSGAANVLAKLARVVVTVPGSSFNYTNAVDGNYTTGLNLGPVGFTNN